MIVYLEIRTWIGSSALGAIHYYGELVGEDITFVLRKTLSSREARELNKVAKATGFPIEYKAGDKYTGFLDKQEIVDLALETWKEQFLDGTILIKGDHAVAEPQEILVGPEDLKEAVNSLVEQAKDLDWDSNRLQMTEICLQWDILMKPYEVEA
jgi:hypothetical protein